MMMGVVGGRAAVLGTLYLHFLFTAKTPAQTNHQNTTNVLLNATKSSIFDSPKPIRNASQLPIIFGRTVDGILLQIIEYTLRDLIAPWLCHIVRKPKFLMDILREDIWNGIIRLRERAIKIDASKMIAVDMVLRITVHMEKIRIAHSRSLETGNEPLFATTSYLVTNEKELEFLGKLSEIMIIFLLPKGYSYSPIKNLLCEILSYKILYPTIKLLTAPDYINQKIVQFIETKLAVAAICKRSYEYAASFEDVLKIINSTENLDDLLLIRTTIINDIMQATAMQNLQRAKGLDPDDYRSSITNTGTISSSSSSTTSSNNPNTNNNNNSKKKYDETTNLTKSDITASIKLKRYIQQLTFAKTQCEKNLTKFGWEGNYSNDLDLSMLDILSTVIGRRYLILFLEPLKASGLVGFYSSVEELKNSSRNNYHQIGAEIFYTYIRAPLSDVKVDKQVRKRMESFLLGDQGPEIFYETQQSILKTLDERYYSPFLLSEQYQQLKNALTSEDIKDISVITQTSNNYGLIESSTTSFDGERTTTGADGDDSINNQESIDEQQNVDTNQTDLTNNSTYARNKLEQLQEKLNNKIQALDAIKSSLKPESKLLAILEKDVDWLKMEKRQMEAHLSRTEIWSEHLGKWRATVQSVEIPDEKEPPQFMILVQADNVINVNINNNMINKKNNTQSNNNNNNNNNNNVNDKNEKCDMENISTGWVVLRSLNEIHELRRKLRPLCSDLRLFDLPTTAFKLFFLKNDRSSLDKAKGQIQKYLNFVLENEYLYQSEALYEFLSPSSEHLKKSVQPSPKKSKFSLSTLFKSDNKETMNRNVNDPFWGPGGSRNEGEEDISMFLEGIGSTSNQNHNNNIGNTTTGSTKSTINSTTVQSHSLGNNTSDGGHTTGSDNCKSDSNDSKDSIAEPLYALMGEIFDMGGVFNWIRRRLISFVQITYGRTINRQIRESINSLFDEAMLQYYATTALKSFWPGGVLASSYPERTEDMKEMTENAAKSLLIDNIPEVLCNLVGAQTARHGAFRVFEILQNATYNKQLFYELVEILMLELFPEIRQLKHESFRKRNI